MGQGITLRQATSGEILEGSALLPFLRWNPATNLWEAGAGGATASAAQQAVETVGSEIVPALGTTTSADGPLHTALAVAGVAAFPAGAGLIVEWITKVAATGAGDVFGTMDVEISVDGGTVWTSLGLIGRSTFTAPGLNNPITNIVEYFQVDLSGLPSFRLRAVFGNADVGATVSASFGEPRIKWSYLSPA